MHHFLRCPIPNSSRATKWLGFAILYHGSKKDTRHLLKSGASPLIRFHDDFEMLRRLYHHDQLNNFKRLLLRGARYYNHPRNNLCLYETFNQLELPNRMKDYVQALIDYGAFQFETVEPGNSKPKSLKELAYLKITQNILLKTHGTPSLHAILTKVPFPDLQENLGKYLVESARYHSHMLLFRQIKRLQRKSSRKKYARFFKAVEAHFNNLQAQKYNLITAAVRDTDATYDLKIQGFNSIFDEAHRLLN
ncbi:hypothetical protein Noda2021_08380 [Candidatus Dependentiae bacterium Noda2021]|nr:hypothetical protein Noda2021_08380 [Candidatus Dependentiae bacterium Noda2021]